jgi:hypothetical protein
VEAVLALEAKPLARCRPAHTAQGVAAVATGLTGPSGHIAIGVRRPSVRHVSLRAWLPGPLRIASRWAPSTADVACPAPPVPLVEVTLYADDSVAFGHLALTADRLTELMNAMVEFELVDAFLESLDDGHEVVVGTVGVSRDEICAVGVTGPRRDPARKIPTHVFPVELRLGPYDVSGNIHVHPGTDPITVFRRRRVMVPLTEATIEFDSPDGRRRSRLATILVNRDLTDRIAVSSRPDAGQPDATLELQGRGPVAGLSPLFEVRKA